MMPFEAMRLRGGGGSDPYFAYVVSLLHCNGADASTTLTDVTGKTWTIRNTPSIVTDQSVFGGASARFDGGGSEDHWDTPDHADWEFGSGDFTMEGRVRFTSVIGAETVLSKAVITSPFSIDRSGTDLLFYSSSNTTTWDIANAVVIGGSLSIDTWYAWAVDRVGTNIYLYLNGTLNNTISTSAILHNNASTVRVGSFDGTSGASFGGHQDEIRFTNGIGRYGGSNYSIATSAFPDS